MKRRFLSFAMALILIISLLPGTALATAWPAMPSVPYVQCFCTNAQVTVEGGGGYLGFALGLSTIETGKPIFFENILPSSGTLNKSGNYAIKNAVYWKTMLQKKVRRKMRMKYKV